MLLIKTESVVNNMQLNRTHVVNQVNNNNLNNKLIICN